MRTRIFPLTLLLTLALVSSRTECAESRPPNIIFILADDLGYHDLACYGSKFYETPNIDLLATQGMRFTDAYAACPVCSPTRASLLTGKYPARLHLTDWIPGSRTGKLLPAPYLHELPLEELTLAEALHEGGYATAFIGKWHLGGPRFYPQFQGFDSNLGGCELGHPPSYFSPYKIPTLPDGPKHEYLTDRLTDEAIKFLDEHKDTDKPFFLYLCHYAVHNPQQAKPKLVRKYKEKLASSAPPPGPEFLAEHDHEARQIQDKPVYAAMVDSLDQSVGRIIQSLHEHHLDDNTILIFTSDNGGLSTAEGAPTSNAPLRAGKGWLYEGGVREPLIVRWPGVTQPGSTCAAPLTSADFYPTLLEAARLPPRPQQHSDGVSFLPLLKGQSRAPRPLFWHYPHYSNQGGPPCGSVRDGDWKLIEFFEDDHLELYNLKDDEPEQHDLAAAHPDRAAQLRDQLHTWRKQVTAAMPTPNPTAPQGNSPRATLNFSPLDDD